MPHASLGSHAPLGTRYPLTSMHSWTRSWPHCAHGLLVSWKLVRSRRIGHGLMDPSGIGWTGLLGTVLVYGFDSRPWAFLSLSWPPGPNTGLPTLQASLPLLHACICRRVGVFTLCSTCHCSSTTTRMDAQGQRPHLCFMTRTGRLCGRCRICWLNAPTHPLGSMSSWCDGRGTSQRTTPGPGSQTSWTSPSSLPCDGAHSRNHSLMRARTQNKKKHIKKALLGHFSVGRGGHAYGVASRPGRPLPGEGGSVRV